MTYYMKSHKFDHNCGHISCLACGLSYKNFKEHEFDQTRCILCESERIVITRMDEFGGQKRNTDPFGPAGSILSDNIKRVFEHVVRRLAPNAFSPASLMDRLYIDWLLHPDTRPPSHRWVRQTIDEAMREAGTYFDVRPTPPKGYERFDPETERIDDGARRRCYFCDEVAGLAYKPSNTWSHPTAQKADEIFNCVCGTEVMVHGLTLNSHWSRYGTGTCLSCDTMMWHDFGGWSDGKWHWYRPGENLQVVI